MLFTERFKAAFAAFKAPWLVGEAKSMRKTMRDLWFRGDVALIEAERHGRLLLPIIRHLPGDIQNELRVHAGRTYNLTPGVPTGANPMIQAAMDAGEDATGLCTFRDVVLELLSRKVGDVCELAFPLTNGRRVNVEVRITKLDEVELP